ncbi:MAG: flagellar basal body P-ring formation chaperone FlgA [Bdellovibrionia bacterium]
MKKNEVIRPSSVRFFLPVLGIFASIFVYTSICFGADDPAVLTELKKQISESYGAAEVKFSGPIDWIKQTPGKKGKSVQILNDNARGELRFSVAGTKGEYSEGSLAFSAWIPARIAVKRVHPGELLRNEWFVTQKVKISTGTAREFRGVLLPSDNEISKLESVQTIMEGQFLTSSAVRNVPDVRRGDSVRIHLLNEGLILSTPGVAQEPGYLNRQIRVLTSKTKRELLGQLQPEGIVEVKL